jgi:hypothetical protein
MIMQRKKSIEWPIADEGLISALKGVIDNILFVKNILYYQAY